MAMQTVEFRFYTGLQRQIFRNPRLSGSWDSNGRHSKNWIEVNMAEETGEDGCPLFSASVSLDLADQGKTFMWGVVLDGPQGNNFWGIPTEVKDANSVERFREFQLSGNKGTQVERYFFTFNRRLGANKRFRPGKTTPELHFSAWAPNAKGVEVVFGEISNGYIADNGTGINTTLPTIQLTRLDNDIWEGDANGDFEKFKSQPYMYRILNAQNNIVYRTDIFSRSQIGKGNVDPGIAWSGTADTLNGYVSCSVVIDPDVVRRDFNSTPQGKQPDLIPAVDFWGSEFTPGIKVPSRLEDLIIYELHIGALGFGKTDPGDLSDAISFLDHLLTLGVNAVELLPMSQFSSSIGWGYGNTHHLCIESSAGGRDKYRHFVRECHRRGIAVIQDVVYNHYSSDAKRAEWQFDSDTPEQNIYYWYEGKRLSAPPMNPTSFAASCNFLIRSGYGR